MYTVVSFAGVMELVDVVDSKSTGGDTVPVRVRPPAPAKKPVFDLGQKQVSFYFIVTIFMETIKTKDYDSLYLSLACL